MKTKIIIAALLALNFITCGRSQAATYVMNGKTISKLEAVMALAHNRDAEVYKMDRVELTDKATLKNKKAVK